MKAIVSVTGKDRTGIIAAVAGELASNNTNILDITQTIVHGNFVMLMHVEASDSVDLGTLGDKLQSAVKDWGIVVHVQHEDLFSSMHRV
ncbi:MAG: ACT domain-containing protein [Clostridiales bacterium]|nr:ACT domain-containing protein [Clostridiales bacterium]